LRGGLQTRSKWLLTLWYFAVLLPLIILAAVAEGTGNNQTASPMAEADIPSNEERNLLGDIDLVVQIIKGIFTILVSIAAIIYYLKRGDKKSSSNIMARDIGDGAVITQNQMGGQAAQKIENYGLMPRQITGASARVLVSELQKYPSEQFHIQYVGGDYEVLELAESINSVLVEAKWKSEGMAEVNRHPPLIRWGIRLFAPEARPSFDFFLKWLIDHGFEVDPQLTNGDALTIQIGKNR